MKRTYPAMFSIIVTGILFGNLSVEEADAVGPPTVTINLAQSKQTAYVAPGQEGVVTFTGQVTVEVPWCPSIQYLIVYIDGEIEDWVVSNPPPLIFSKETTSQSFSMTVQVPPETKHETYELIVSGRWQYSPGRLTGDVEPTSALVVTAQYFACCLNPEETRLEGERGDTVDFPVTAHNAGNGEDRMEIEVTNIDYLYENGIETSLSESQLILDYKENKTVDIFAMIDYNTPRNTFTIEMKIRSIEAEELGVTSEPSYCRVILDVVKEVTESEEDQNEQNYDEENINGYDEEDNDDLPSDEGSEQEEGKEGSVDDERVGNLQESKETPFPGLLSIIIALSMVTFSIRKKFR